MTKILYFQIILFVLLRMQHCAFDSESALSDENAGCWEIFVHEYVCWMSCRIAQIGSQVDVYSVSPVTPQIPLSLILILPFSHRMAVPILQFV